MTDPPAAPVPDRAVTDAKHAIHDQVCKAWHHHDEARDLASAQAAVHAAAPAIREAERQRIRQLAIGHKATYVGMSGTHDGVPVPRALPFADLIGDGS